MNNLSLGTQLQKSELGLISTGKNFGSQKGSFAYSKPHHSQLGSCVLRAFFTWMHECDKVSTLLLLATVYFIHLLFGNTTEDLEYFIMPPVVSSQYQ